MAHTQKHVVEIERMGHGAVHEYCRVNSRTAVQAYQSATARFIHGRKLVSENANQWFLSSRQGNAQPIEKALLGHGGRFWREGVPSRRAGSAGGGGGVFGPGRAGGCRGGLPFPFTSL